MDSSHQANTILALEAATDALMAALRRRPDPDLEAAAVALKAREAAMKFLVGSDPNSRPPDMNARLRRILDSDREAADQLRAEMDSLRGRLASTRQMMNDYRSRGRPKEPTR
jgi:site-specific recombinase